MSHRFDYQSLDILWLHKGRLRSLRSPQDARQHASNTAFLCLHVKKTTNTIYSVKSEDILRFAFNREPISELIVKSIPILLHNKSIIYWAIWVDRMLLHLVRTIRYDLIMHRNNTSMFAPLIDILFFSAHVPINRQCAIGAHS